jgi:hypothetical protein
MGSRGDSGGASGADEKNFDRLVSDAMPEGGSFVRPADEAILAYLHGAADEAQRDQVQQALLASSAFRHELLALGADLDELAGENARERFDRVPEPDVPDLRAFARVDADEVRGEAHDAGPTPLGATREPSLAQVPGMTRRWRRIGWFAGIAAAAAVLVLLLVLRRETAAPEAPWVRQPIDLRPEIFVPVTLRGFEEEPEPFTVEAEAAVARFQERVVWENGTFLPEPVAGEPGTEHTVLPVASFVQLLGKGGEVVAAYHAAVPRSLEGPGSAGSSGNPSPGACAGVHAWLMTLPDLNLYSAPLDACTLRVPVPSPSIRRGCLTLTFPMPGGYLATEAGYFDLDAPASER